MQFITILFFTAVIAMAFRVIHTMFVDYADQISEALAGNNLNSDLNIINVNFRVIKRGKSDFALPVNHKIILPLAA